MRGPLLTKADYDVIGNMVVLLEIAEELTEPLPEGTSEEQVKLTVTLNGTGKMGFDLKDVEK